MKITVLSAGGATMGDEASRPCIGGGFVRSAVACAVLAASFLASARVEAQAVPVTVPPERSDAWGKASNIMAISAGALQVVLPRVFYADPEVTAGWKARWHVSVLAPAMTLATLTLVNDSYLKDSFAGRRPGCDDTNQGLPGCTSFGMLSSPSFAAFSAFGQGTGVFLVDTLKWSDGRLNGGALVGEVGVPLVLAILTAVGRGAGNWESGGQVWGSAGIGTLTGLGTGVLYAVLQRPECGYTGNLICW